MKKSYIVWIAVAVIVFIAVFWGISTYNNLVLRDEGVTAQWSNVENQYQRRNDLIPNLVNTVKGYATHESSTLEGVIAARSRATQVTVDIDDAEEMKRYQAAQGDVTQALGKLLAISENYPELKANQNFLELQAQLEGTENRIAVERTRYNDAAKSYNTTVRKFPVNLIASIADFEKKAYFEADEKAEEAPEVKF